MASIEDRLERIEQTLYEIRKFQLDGEELDQLKTDRRRQLERDEEEYMGEDM